MKKICTHLLFLFAFLVFQNCDNSLSSVEKRIMPADLLSEVKQWYNDVPVSTFPKNSRDLHSPVVLWDKRKIYRYGKERFIINIPLLNPQATKTSFYQLIAFRDSKSVRGLIVEVIPDKAYLKKDKGRYDNAFSGQIKTISKTGKKIRTQKFVDGAEVDFYSKDVSALRTAFGEDDWWNDGEAIWLDEVVIEGDSWEDDDSWIWVDDPWDDYDPYEDDEWEDDYWMYDDYNNDGNGDVGIQVDNNPVDISYYLQPTKPGDNLNKPYDGMTAKDRNGVVYTYNASLGVWLMPEFIALSNVGDYQIKLDNRPQFQSAVLVTMAPIALGEPTFVGELVLAGTAIVVGVVFVYEMVDYMRKVKEEDLDHCINLYSQLCRGEYGYKNMPCDVCLSFCRAQGYWDFARCPLSD